MAGLDPIPRLDNPEAVPDASVDTSLPMDLSQSAKLDDLDTPKPPDAVCTELIHQPKPNILSNLPNIWTHQYQMGPTPYVDALGANEAIAEHLKIEWTPSNSPFSEHVSALKNILREKWDGMGRSPESYPDL